MIVVRLFNFFNTNMYLEPYAKLELSNIIKCFSDDVIMSNIKDFFLPHVKITFFKQLFLFIIIFIFDHSN